ncbi:OPT oligopeptide transporter protein-domain-containing protein [Kockovaella imperatae]|uniref:OPT oligopeptide transporter protein-domain-containing protein n=1 Tax=Kockovaella imperatae TaxID=4999 RepID=A0A1Y1U884_9TREE|nr:OPT oligopeptide transporter protein-domain-containing protein [Kockovaella imperatae]ORX34223.1 OPT oligopeptide transporter protein-domain-containing protein [Kockovaella imperatae]
MTKEDLEATEILLDQMTLERTQHILTQTRALHQHDQNFSFDVLERINLFLENPDIAARPDKHADLIREMKLEAILVTENSPYSEVRAVVDNFDEPELPVFTFRTWTLGIGYVVIGSFINQLFELRQPAIYITSEVAQLLAFPGGKLFERFLPDWGLTVRGQRYSMNPGPFNRKEHMLITIMATVGYNTPYTTNIILSQYLPQYFNQPYAKEFAYQILLGIATNFCGFGLAGLARRFLVYPSYCVWPASLVTIALNQAFHKKEDHSVSGPLGKTYTWSRLKLFSVAFGAMFVWFWIVSFIFPALSTFNWISWINSTNVPLNLITGSNNGLGLNPFPTFDFNNLTAFGWNPLVIPSFSTLNIGAGMLLGFFIIIVMYWTNAYHTAYLPINSNKVFDNTGARFDVQRVINDKGLFDREAYQTYSQPWMAAGNIVVYWFFFAQYAATVSYAYLFHRHEIKMGFRSLYKSLRFRRASDEIDEDDITTNDIHMRLMRKYKEVPEWWFLIILLVAIATGVAALAHWDTYSSPAIPLYGIALALLFVIPVGMITAITGLQVTMNVLAELIGGSVEPGNALSMNFFKAFGYITTAQAVYFSNDLKVAHYLKIPPRCTFAAQIIAVAVSTFVCTGVFNFQMTGIKNVCTSQAAFDMTCPGINTFFTAAVFWGTFGPPKLFGPGGQYVALLSGFPFGFALPIVMYWLRKKFPNVRIFRQLHPVMFLYGGIQWAPYNLTYMWPSIPIACLSWLYMKKRHLAFWSKYNFVLAAAFSSGIAIAGVIIFFSVQFPDITYEWWGTDVSYQGCEGTACVLKTELPAKGYFGPDPGSLPF